MSLSPIHQIINYLQNSLTALQVEIPEEEAEKIGTIIFLAMENTHRKFHNSNHILQVCQDMSPLQTLAGLFHDIVYYQIDGGFPPSSHNLLNQFIEVKADGLYIQKGVGNNNIFNLNLAVFGFQQGQKLEIFGGQNEFLSTLLGGLLLEKYISLNLFMSFAACIESTIPFRQTDVNGLSPYDKLKTRLKNIANQYNFELQDVDLEVIIKQCVGLANRDVENFAALDVGKFIDGTWTLLPESHAQLWYGGVYSVVSYRNALYKMEGFFSILQPDVIFDQYNHYPDDLTYHKLTQQATQNVAIAREYIGIKLLPIAIIEAAAMLTGGDAPLSFFMGDVRSYHKNIRRAEDFLSPLAKKHSEIDPIIDNLLEFGRTSPTSFDLQHSPLASFIYQKMGATACKKAFLIAKSFFTQQITASEFLQQIDKEVSISIIKSCAEIATTRQTKLLALCNI